MTTTDFLNEVVNCLKSSDKIEDFTVSTTMEHIFSAVIIKATFKNGTTNEYRLTILKHTQAQDKYFNIE